MIIRRLLTIDLSGELPLLSDKNSSFSKITLIENELLLNDDEKISSTLNDFFSNVVSNLNIPPHEDPSVNPEQFEDQVLKANKKYKYHPSIKAIKEKNLNKTFTFQIISRSDIKKKITSGQFKSNTKIRHTNINKILTYSQNTYFMSLKTLWRNLNIHLLLNLLT